MILSTCFPLRIKDVVTAVSEVSRDLAGNSEWIGEFWSWEYVGSGLVILSVFWAGTHAF